MRRGRRLVAFAALLAASMAGLALSGATREWIYSTTSLPAALRVHLMPTTDGSAAKTSTTTIPGSTHGSTHDAGQPTGARPAPSTTSKLDMLVQRHKALHRRMLAGDVPPRLLVMACPGGFGNTMMAMVTDLLYAVMAERALLVACAVPDMFDHIGMDMVVDAVLAQSSQSNAELVRALNAAKAATTAAAQPSSIVVDAADDMFACDAFNGDASTSGVATWPVVVTRSFYYQGTLVLRHPLYRDRWAELLEQPLHTIPAALLSRFFWPNEAMLRRLQMLKLPFVNASSQFVEATFVVGLQIRGKDWFPGKGKALRFWIECVRALHADVSKTRERRLHIHVATDIVENRAALAAEFGADSVSFIDVPGLFDTVEGAFLEILALAHCDALVLTQGSTFGYIAALYHAARLLRQHSARPALIFRALAYENDQAVAIARHPQLGALVAHGESCIAVSSEPCFHGFKAYGANPPRCWPQMNQTDFKEHWRSDSFPYC